MRMREIDALDDFYSIKKEWDRLLLSTRSKNIFLTWEWNYTWFKHYGKNKNLLILLFEDDGEINGILPLVRSKYYNRIFSYDVLENMGIPNSDYSGIIISDKCNEIADQIFDQLGKFIKTHRIIFQMKELPKNVELYQILKKRLFLNGIYVREQPSDHCPYIPIQGSWEEYYSKLSKKLRHDISRRKRKFRKEIGEPVFRKCMNDDNLENDFNIFLDLQSMKRRSKGLNEGYKEMEKSEQEFLYEISQIFKANGWLRLSFLEVNGAAISCDLSFEYDNIYYDYLPAFNPQYRSYSIGIIHQICILKNLFQKGVKEYDFMRGNESYKSDWTSLKRDNEHIIAYDDSFTLDINLLFLNYVIKFRKGLI